MLKVLSSIERDAFTGALTILHDKAWKNLAEGNNSLFFYGLHSGVTVFRGKTPVFVKTDSIL